MKSLTHHKMQDIFISCFFLSLMLMKLSLIIFFEYAMKLGMSFLFGGGKNIDGFKGGPGPQATRFWLTDGDSKVRKNMKIEKKIF